jgi:hypothetical protein
LTRLRRSGFGAVSLSGGTGANGRMAERLDRQENGLFLIFLPLHISACDSFSLNELCSLYIISSTDF